MSQDHEAARRALVRAYHRTFTTAEGHAVLADLGRTFRHCLPALVLAPDGKVDPNQVIYADGQKSAVAYIHEVLRQAVLDDEEPNPQTPKVIT